jgi:hypothetical protein
MREELTVVSSAYRLSTPETSVAEFIGTPFESIARRSLDGAYGVELE